MSEATARDRELAGAPASRPKEIANQPLGRAREPGPDEPWLEFAQR